MAECIPLENDEQEPMNVCQLTFVKVSTALKLVLTTITILIGIVSGVIAYEYHNGQSIAVLQSKQEQVQEDLNSVLTIQKTLDAINTKLDKIRGDASAKQ